jgi:hypothetical protein
MSQQPSRVSADLVLSTPKGKAKATPVAHEGLGDGEVTRLVDTTQATMAPTPVATRTEEPAARARQPKIALNFRADPELHQRLRNLAFHTDTPIQQIVETSVLRYLASVGY